MGCFPFFVDLKQAHGIIVGGKQEALEKIRRLKPYGPILHVIAPQFIPEIEEEEGLIRIRRPFQESDLKERPLFVIAASEDHMLNHQVSEACRRQHILVNVVDDPSYCDFIFPSLIQRGSLSIGICTQGASPATGVLLRRQIEQQLPDEIAEILEFLQEKRPLISRTLTDKKARFSFYYQLSERCLKKSRRLSEEEFEALLIESLAEAIQ